MANTSTPASPDVQPIDAHSIDGREDTLAAQQKAGLEDTVAAPSGGQGRGERGGTGTLTDFHSDAGSAASERALSGELKVVDRDDYDVHCELARGGMGRIMRARDRRHGRVVVLKESLRPDPVLLARFTREAMITARLQHPAIVPVYEAGKWKSGDPFYAMKMVDGTSLSQEIEERTELAQRMELLPNLLAVADALAYAHTSGVLHRDLKPSNVLIGSFGETVVIDWGLAKVLGDGSSDEVPIPGLDTGAGDAPDLTAAGHVIGTPVYMAPEQATGKPVDQRADVYSLGAIAYHLLVGSPPYVGDSSADVLDLVLEGPPLPVRERECAVPADLAAIVDKAMARDPSERYPSAKELAEDLRRFHTGQLVSTHAYSLREHLGRFLGKHRGAVAVATIMLLCMVGLGGWAVSQIVEERNTARHARAQAEELGRMANEQRERAEKLNAAMLAMLDQRNEATGEQLIREDMAKRIATYYESPSHPGWQIRQGEPAVQSLHVLAKQAYTKGDIEAALTLFQKSQDYARKLAAKRPLSVDVRRIVAENHGRIANLLVAKGDTRAARDEYRAAIDAFHALAAAEDAPGDLNAHLGHLYAQLSLLQFLADDDDGWQASYDKSREHARALHHAIEGPDEGDGDDVMLSVATQSSSPIENASGESAAFSVSEAGASAVDIEVDIEALHEHVDKFRARFHESVSVSPGVNAVRGDPARLARRSDAPAAEGLVFALEDMEQQLRALGKDEASLEFYSKLAAAMEEDGELEASVRTRADAFMKFAEKLAHKNREKAAEYAGRCVDLLEKERTQTEHVQELDATLMKARARLEELRSVKQ